LASVRPVDPEAHDGYLRGRYILGLAPAHLSKLTDKTQYDDLDIQAAIGDFKHAIEIDPAYAMAYAGTSRRLYHTGKSGLGRSFAKGDFV